MKKYYLAKELQLKLIIYNTTPHNNVFVSFCYKLKKKLECNYIILVFYLIIQNFHAHCFNDVYSAAKNIIKKFSINEFILYTILSITKCNYTFLFTGKTYR